MSCLNQMLSGLKKNISLFLSVLLLTMTVAIFGPLELYFTNYEEFWFASRDIGIVVAFLAGSCFVASITIGLLLRGRGRELYSSILFALGLALYIQGNYANINYGILDGKSIDWSAYPIYAALDTAGWLILFIVIMFLWFQKRSLFYKVQSIGALWIIAIQIVTLIILILTTDALKIEKSNYYLSNEGMYEVSSNENIIVFVLDSFDDMLFQEILETEPEKYKTVFEDFTHFNNAAAGGWATKFGMPAIITGEAYPGEISYSEYIEQAFDRDKLYSTLQEQNYDVRIFSKSTFVPDGSSQLVDNQISTGYIVSSYPRLTQKYLSLTLYKYMPHVLKKFFWIYTGEFEEFKVGNSAEAYAINDIDYFGGLQENGLAINQDKNVFRLIHLNGPHMPYTYDEYVQRVESKDTSVIGQGKGALYIVESYINKMKEYGIYDAATIVITADHGMGNTSTLGAHGMLLVKDKNHRGAYMESAAPVSYYDLHATLFHALDITTEGATFFEIPEGTRERYMYADDHNTAAVEYVIEGNLNSNNVLRKTGIILQPSRKEYYEYGETLIFGWKSTAQPFVRKGISSIDDLKYSWTNGKECEFKFEFKKAPKRNLLVTLDILATNSINGPQKVIFYANDIECYRKILSGGTQLQFVIPGSTIKNDRELILRMELPNAVSPATFLGPGNDERELALALQGLCIDETDADNNYLSVEPLDHYDFGQEGNAEAYLLDGWHAVETDHRWTSTQAEMMCKTVEHCDYQMELHYAYYTPSGNTNIYFNDTLIGILDGSESTVKFKITADILRDNGNQVISFETPAAISPKEAGENGDERVLGICVYSLDLKPMDSGK